MPRIDIRRNTNVRFVDGFSATALVNNVAGYPAGTTTMTIDTVVSGPVVVFAQFEVAGSKRIHVVTATDGTTTITFTPALTGAVLDNAVITFGGRSLDLKHAEGEVTYSEHREYEYETDRGQLGEGIGFAKQLDDVPMDVEISLIWEYLTAADGETTPTMEDVLKQTGPASTWESSEIATCADYALNIQLEVLPQCDTANVQREIITLEHFRWEDLDHNAGESSIAMTGRCNATEAIRDRRD